MKAIFNPAEFTDAPALFALGGINATPGAIRALQGTDQQPGSVAFLQRMRELLARHVTGDWGDVDADDAAENDLSVVQEYRILSSYKAPGDETIWIITEADRSTTTFLLPEEY